MKNRGFGLFELIVCMSFVFIILIQFTDLSLNLFETNSKLMKDNEVKNNVYNIYKEIGYDFLTYNIKSISKNNNQYIFNYYRNDEQQVTVKTLTLENDELIYSDLEYPYYVKSTENFSIEDIKIIKDNKFVKLTITINEEEYDIICSNKIGDVNI